MVFRLCMFLLFLFCAVEGHSHGKLSETERASIEGFISKLLSCKQIPALSLAIVRNSTTVYTSGYGKADIDKDIDADENTLFMIASISKHLSAVLLAIQLNENNIPWDTKLKDILGDFRMPDDHMTEHTTLNDIVSHRTGLTANDVAMQAGGFSNREDAYRHIRYFASDAEFRNDLVYNNIVFSVAAKISEALGGKSWEQLMKEKLWEPLGMTSSNFYNFMDPDYEGLAKLYSTRLDGSWFTVPKEMARFVNVVGPAGAIVLTAADAAKYLEFIIRKGKTSGGTILLPEDKFEEIFQPQMSIPTNWLGGALELKSTPVRRSVDVYSRGCMLGYYRGHRVISAYGDTGLISFLPEVDLAFYTVASSTEGPSPMLLLHNYVIDLLLGHKPWINSSTVCAYPSPWKPAAPEPEIMMMSSPINKTIPPSRSLMEYSGFYGNFGLGNVSVYINESSGNLQLKYGVLAWFNLYPATSGDDKFATQPLGMYTEISAFSSEFNPDYAYVQFIFNETGSYVIPTFVNFHNLQYFEKGLKIPQ